jgi:hypothetical protein
MYAGRKSPMLCLESTLASRQRSISHPGQHRKVSVRSEVLGIGAPPRSALAERRAVERQAGRHGFDLHDLLVISVAVHDCVEFGAPDLDAVPRAGT